MHLYIMWFLIPRQSHILIGFLFVIDVITVEIVISGILKL